MNSAIERLLTLRVCDIMNTVVATIPNEVTMSEAAQILAEFDVTGAPVVDPGGRCVGVLSSTDFADRTRRLANTESSQEPTCVAFSPDRESQPIDAVAEDCVDDHMSPIVQTVSKSAPIMSAARLMCHEHIHRLVIVDEDQRPVGVVSSLDLVAAMVAAIEE